MPTTKPETRYADLLEDKVSAIKYAFSTDVPTPEYFSRELERHISQTIRVSLSQ